MSAHESATDYVFSPKDCLVGAQMLFVAFGALVLVPLLTGLNPNVALILVCGIGGMVLPFGKFILGGIGLSGILGVVLNLVLPGKRES